MGSPLLEQRGLCGGRDQAGAARVPLGDQGAGAAAQLEVARDGSAAHAKEAGRFALAQAAINGLENLGAEVMRIGMHTISITLPHCINHSARCSSMHRALSMHVNYGLPEKLCCATPSPIA